MCYEPLQEETDGRIIWITKNAVLHFLVWHKNHNKYECSINKILERFVMFLYYYNYIYFEVGRKWS